MPKEKYRISAKILRDHAPHSDNSKNQPAGRAALRLSAARPVIAQTLNLLLYEFQVVLPLRIDRKSVV